MVTIQTTEAYVWAINNFAVIQQTADQLLFQQVEIVLGKPSTVQTRWIASFQLSELNKAKLVLKLKEHNTSSHLTVTGNISDSKYGPNGVFGHLKKLNTPTQVDQHQILTFDFDGDVLVHSSDWDEYCDNDGKIYIKIELTVEGKTPLVDISCKAAWTAFRDSSVSDLQENLATLLTEKKFADMKIVTGDGKEFSAHRAVLSARNAVFGSMMSSKMSESETGIVIVDDVRGETMEILLYYIYAGKLLPGWTKSEVVENFVYAVGKYQLSAVFSLLDEVLGSEDVPSCNIRLLTLANKLGLKKAEARLTVKFKKLIENLNGEELIQMFGSMCDRSQNTEDEASSSMQKCLPPAE